MGAYPFNYFGDVPYHNVTLDFVLEYPEMGANVTIRQVMDIFEAPLGPYVYA
jgi:tyrosinase